MTAHTATIEKSLNAVTTGKHTDSAIVFYEQQAIDFDGDSNILTVTPTDGALDGTAVPRKTAQDALKRVGKGAQWVMDNGQVTIKAGKASLKLPSLHDSTGRIIANAQAVQAQKFYAIDTSTDADLIDKLKQLAPHMAGNKDVRYFLRSIMLMEHEGQGYWVACNGHTIARATATANPRADMSNKELLIGSDLVAYIIKRGEIPSTMAQSHDYTTVRLTYADGSTVYGNAEQGKYPAVARFGIFDNTNERQELPADFFKGIKWVAGTGANKSHKVVFYSDATQNKAKGDHSAQILARYDMANPSRLHGIALAPEYMAMIAPWASHVVADEVGTVTSLAVQFADADNVFRAVVMPVRI